MWGFAPLLRRLGNDFGFTSVVIGACVDALRADAARLASAEHRHERVLVPRPGLAALFLPSASSGAVPVFGYGRWWTIFTAGWLHASAPAHPVQHDVGPATWARRRRTCTARAGSSSSTPSPARSDSLASTLAGVLLPGVPIIGGAGFTVGASAADLRPARRAGALRPPHRAAAWFAARRGRGRSRCSCSACSCRVSTTGRTPAGSPAATSRRCGSIR
ncbi:MAG: hypothetical protein MZU79_00670 [Anaerotruncus sp.]|nr:hypothetical protein [Anaerotruncus sp.]